VRSSCARARSLSGDEGIQDVRREVEADRLRRAGRAADGGAPAGELEQVDLYRTPGGRAASSTPAPPRPRRRPAKVVVDGATGWPA
jgi:hypothetical protein